MEQIILFLEMTTFSKWVVVQEVKPEAQKLFPL